MAEDRQALAMKYLELLQSGTPAAEAFKQVYPNGIPTAAQQAREASKEKQSNALAGTGGTIAGLLGIKYGMKGLDALGAETATTAAEGATGVATVATPTGVTLAPAGTAASSAAAPSMFALEGIGSAGNVLLPALGALGGYDLVANQLKTGDKKRGALQGAASGAAMGSYFGAPGAIIGGVLGLGAGLTSHESTKDTQKRRWGGLSESAQGLYQANHPDGDTGTWDSGKYAGQKWSFDKALDLAKDDPTHFQGVYGNMSAIGDDYLKADDAIQKEFVRKNIAAGNYASNKGDVIIKDHDLAKQLFAQSVNPQAQAIQRPVVTAQPQQSEAFKKKQLALNGQFGNQLLQAINK